MGASVCKWYGGADSPVIFMVDDFANVWVDLSGSGRVETAEDWGYAKDGESSSFRFLNEHILSRAPAVKTLFFTPVGVRTGVIRGSKIGRVSKMINCDEDTKDFFRRINESDKYEIAYHGTTHGKAGDFAGDFRQEWETYESLDEAISVVEWGRRVYRDVFGSFPNGGKYCGYKGSRYGDESIDRTGFLWWCRYWNRGAAKDRLCEIGGGDDNPMTNFDIKLFGKSGVVDLPSTIDGGMLTDVLRPDTTRLKGMAKALLKGRLVKARLGEIDYLLKNRLVISIQEHISPARNDGNRQFPNIFDDRDSLKIIFDYLKDKNVWYCTGTELAQYFLLRKSIYLRNLDGGGFAIEHDSARSPDGMKISIRIDEKARAVVTPHGNMVHPCRGVFNLEVMKGEYRIE